jgi:hypothetical protein
MVMGTGWVLMNKDKKMEIGGWEMPNWMQHHPDIQVLKLYAMAKESFQKVPKYIKDPEDMEAYKQDHNLANSVESIALNTIHETPFLDERTLGITSSPDKLNRFLSSFASSIFVPQIARDIQGLTDSEKRKPSSFIEQIEAGIPGLSKNVPTEKEAEQKKYADKFIITHDPYHVLDKKVMTRYATFEHSIDKVMSEYNKLLKTKSEEEVVSAMESDKKDINFMNKNGTVVNRFKEALSYYKDMNEDEQKEYKEAMEENINIIVDAYSSGEKAHLTHDISKLEHLMSKDKSTRDITKIKTERELKN